MAEVHIIGEITGASGFPNHNLFCKWGVTTGGAWKLLEGTTDGQTQVDNPQNEAVAYWCHPVDIHFATQGLQGWPKFNFQVWHQDGFGRIELYGYGFTNVPMSPGFHSINCVTWQPVGSLRQRIVQYFLGGAQELRNLEVVSAGINRYKLHTQAMGTVHINIHVILRNFEKFGIET